ncbi:hypothetical protein BDF19DRAFT_410931, partial [Syncephalis fuscata]
MHSRNQNDSSTAALNNNRLLSSSSLHTATHKYSQPIDANDDEFATQQQPLLLNNDLASNFVKQTNSHNYIYHLQSNEDTRPVRPVLQQQGYPHNNNNNAMNEDTESLAYTITSTPWSIYRTALRLSVLVDLVSLAALLGAVIGSGTALTAILSTLGLGILRISTFGRIAIDGPPISSRFTNITILFYWMATLIVGICTLIDHVYWPWPSKEGAMDALFIATGVFTLVHTLIYTIGYLHQPNYWCRDLSIEHLLLPSNRTNGPADRPRLHIDPFTNYGALQHVPSLRPAVPIAAAAVEAASLASSRQRMATSVPILIPKTPSSSIGSSRGRGSLVASGRSAHGRGEFTLKRMLDSSINHLVDGQSNLIKEEEYEDDNININTNTNNRNQKHLLPHSSLRNKSREYSTRQCFVNDDWDESVPFSPHLTTFNVKGKLPSSVSIHEPTTSTPLVEPLTGDTLLKSHSQLSSISRITASPSISINEAVTTTNTTTVSAIATAAPIVPNHTYLSQQQPISTKSNATSSLVPSLNTSPDGLPITSHSFFRNAYDTPMHSAPSPAFSVSNTTSNRYPPLPLTAHLLGDNRNDVLPPTLPSINLPLNLALSPLTTQYTSSSLFVPLNTETNNVVLNDEAPSISAIISDQHNYSNGSQTLTEDIESSDGDDMNIDKDGDDDDDDEEEEYEYGDNNPDGFLAPTLDLNADQHSAITTDDDNDSDKENINTSTHSNKETIS